MKQTWYYIAQLLVNLEKMVNRFTVLCKSYEKLLLRFCFYSRFLVSMHYTDYRFLHKNTHFKTCLEANTEFHFHNI